MSQIYELVIYTAGTKYYTDAILQHIDLQKRISHVLYREHCTVLNGSYFLKNMGLLGRNLKQTILVDVLMRSFRITRWLVCSILRFSIKYSPSMEAHTIESYSG
jgi:TFIIF-interacting CTD phosphatase-like protein